MPFVPTRSDYSTQVKTFVEKRPSLPFGPLVGFFVANEELDLLGKETTDRSFTSGSENLGLLEQLPTQTYRDVLLPVVP
ncbi:MAG: hypothetical protein ABR908_07675 [Terriglobales bacterium]|jgi:hypothetical protein